MKVFLSWSGPLSQKLAEAFRSWLPGVLQAVRPYYSSDDITKGARWSTEIAKELEECKVGIIFLTADNLTAPWIMFEAGALSKKLDKSSLCPLLFDLEASDVQGPLVQFQSAKFDENEVRRVVKMMNSALGGGSLESDVLESVFIMWWPKLKGEVEQILNDRSTPKHRTRSERELLEEVLDLTRVIAVTANREKSPKPFEPVHVVELIDRYTKLASQVKLTGAFGVQKKLLLEMGALLEASIARLDGARVNLKLLRDNLLNAGRELISASEFNETTEAPTEDDVPF